MDQKVKISALPAATSVTDADKFVIVQGGQTRRVDYQYVKSLINSSEVLSGTFDNTDLSDGIFTLNHGKGTEDCILQIKNPDGEVELLKFDIVDSDNITVNFGGAISGTWAYKLFYWNATNGGGTLLEKTIDIGAWNINAENSILIPHGLDFSKIVSVSVFIWDETQSRKYNVLGMVSEGGAFVHGAVSFDSSDISINIPSGTWVTSLFSSIAINRGTIYIKYTS